MDLLGSMGRMRIIEFASGGLAASLGTAACVCCVFLFFINRRRWGFPIEWPIIGMLPSLFIHLILNDTYDWLSRTLNKCGGTFMFRGPNDNWSAVITSDPANVEYILKTKFSSFPKGPIFRRAFRDFLGDGILNADGHFWALQRKTAVAEFNSSTSLSHAIESLQESVTGRLIPILDAACSSCRIVDLQDVFMRFTFDNICNRAFGVEPFCLSPSLPAVPFAKAIEVAAEATALRFVTPKFARRFMRRLGLGIDVKLQDALKTIDEFLMDIISSRRKQFISAAVSDDKVPEDLLSVFMRCRDEHGTFLYSEKSLRDVCLNFIFAGRDTTSVALSWFFWLLLQHRHVEDKIVEEIHSILEPRKQLEDNNDPAVRFSKEELKQMHSLHACLSEALRLYPPLPIDRKQVSEDVVLPDGTAVKKDLPTSLKPTSNPVTATILDRCLRSVTQADWLVANSFHGLEQLTVEALRDKLRVYCVGPLLPSAYLDPSDPRDSIVGTSSRVEMDCSQWLDGKPFLWVLRIQDSGVKNPTQFFYVPPPVMNSVPRSSTPGRGGHHNSHGGSLKLEGEFNVDLYPEIYLNVSAFRRSYGTMEKTFRVYLYKDGFRPLVHQGHRTGIYASEGFFIDIMEQGHMFITNDSSKAHMFFLPYSLKKMVNHLYNPRSRKTKLIKREIASYVRTIAIMHPYWNKTQGRDHFFVSCQDWALSTAKGNKQLQKNVIKVICNNDKSWGFNVRRDVSMPQIMIKSCKVSPDARPYQNLGGPASSERPFLAFFAGQMHGTLRPEILKHWGNETDPNMKIFAVGQSRPE